MKQRIRGGSGLGDSIYLRPIVEHFIRAGDLVTVMSDYPDVFLGTGATVEPFNRTNITVTAHYTHGKHLPGTNQWQDLCASARIEEIPLRFEWKVRRRELLDGLLRDAGGRPLVLVHGGREPMGRRDNFGIELLPMHRAFHAVLAALDDCFTVRVGKGIDIYALNVDACITGGTSVSDLLDIGSVCAGVVAQCSFAVPLAEAFDKPLLAVWAARGLQSPVSYIRQIAPGKVLSKPTSAFVQDDWDVELLQGAASRWRQSL